METALRRNNSCFLKGLESAVRSACWSGKPDMSAPEHYRAARLAVPRLPLPAILGFAVAGLGGALFLAYSTFSGAETKHSFASADEVPVYAARAVPKDQPAEDFAQRAISIARALTATTPSDSQRSETRETSEPGREEGEPSDPILLSETNRELRGFSRFANSSAANSYLALTGTTFGMSAQMAPSGFAAPDAETAMSSAVPEASTWLCGAALLALVVARGLHASWYRNHRRGASKGDSPN
jgi:hypothetical protein